MNEWDCIPACSRRRGNPVEIHWERTEESIDGLLDAPSTRRVDCAFPTQYRPWNQTQYKCPTHFGNRPRRRTPPVAVIRVIRTYFTRVISTADECSSDGPLCLTSGTLDLSSISQSIDQLDGVECTHPPRTLGWRTMLTTHLDVCYSGQWHIA